MIDAAEFDRFADEYLAVHARNIEVSGEAPDYFARYKIAEVRRRWEREARAEPRRILDFGAGIGNSIPHLRALFPRAELTALDVSERSLAIAERRFPGMARLVAYDGASALSETVGEGGFDLIFSACVFHHIDETEHARLFAGLRAALAPGGVLTVFEHNALNPVTRHIVATCPFDENAVLVGGGELRRRQRRAGFARVGVRYTGFFPASLKALRPLEPSLAALPIGAQYYTWAEG